MIHMGDNRPTLSSRSHQIATKVRDREGFKTYGALSARVVDGITDPGELAGHDYEVFRDQCLAITYVVWSYRTPIAWWSAEHGWHVVSQRFSRTTSVHQGKLYLIPRD